MHTIYDVILQFLNWIFPNDLAIDLLKLNELLAYVLSLLLVWSILIRPLLKLFRVVK